MRRTIRLMIACLALAAPAAGGAEPPNVVVIISDDAGWADFSVHGSTQIATPRIDSIATRGVRCTSGYVTASVCSPSRAGLMTGRYQQRFGHELNIPARFSEENGLPTTETTLPDLLRPLGYRTIGLGKWHLGYADHFHPCRRGFDDFFGFLQGARSYRPLKKPTRLNRLLRDRAVLPETFEYMTDELGTQAAAYIAAHHERPFFLYLSFNAVHTPMHVKPDTLAAIEGRAGIDGVEPERRRKLIAMTVSLDEAVGRVLDALETHEILERTLLFFVNDNGGATNNASINAPLRGTKGTPFEGGIRIPFLVQWPDVLPAGSVYTRPVSTLDILPTAVAAAGHEGPAPQPLDGVDLVPFLTGAAAERPHETLFWRRADSMAIRHGDWKLLRHRDGPPMLFDLVADTGEQRDLASAEPERVRALLKRYEAWNAELVEPRWRYRQGAGKARGTPAPEEQRP